MVPIDVRWGASDPHPPILDAMTMTNQKDQSINQPSSQRTKTANQEITSDPVAIVGGKNDHAKKQRYQDSPDGIWHTPGSNAKGCMAPR